MRDTSHVSAVRIDTETIVARCRNANILLNTLRASTCQNYPGSMSIELITLSGPRHLTGFENE